MTTKIVVHSRETKVEGVFSLKLSSGGRGNMVAAASAMSSTPLISRDLHLPAPGSVTVLSGGLWPRMPGQITSPRANIVFSAYLGCTRRVTAILDITWMDKEEDDFCTPHKLFNRFSMCTLPSTTTTQTKMEAGADDSDIRQDLHHSSVVGDHIYNSFMFVVFMHFSLYYWFCIDFVIVTDIVIVHSYRPSDVFPQ